MKKDKTPSQATPKPFGTNELFERGFRKMSNKEARIGAANKVPPHTPAKTAVIAADPSIAIGGLAGIVNDHGATTTDLGEFVLADYIRNRRKRVR